MTAADLADLFAAFNRHDIDGIMKHIAADCVFYTVAGPEVHGTRIEGADAIAAAFSGVWAAMPDAEWADSSHFVAGDRGVSEWTFRGTDAEGRRIEAQGADIFTFRGSQIVVKQALRKQRPVLNAK
ncbi:nuclear transport factor 2 family protein [Mangrovicella endophytica]|uniref:nuclear transport factor 2 family protein n=1 Tax=Mangrovicella endophytica TaxID=2066697 RepID=UPI0018E49268|nr:nuclear transport factor 2 family protein [Mangrovicella endophytica]